MARPYIGAWVDKNKAWLKNVDQSSILLVVYTAFSSAVVAGLWSMVPVSSLVILSVVCLLILLVVLAGTTYLAQALRFNKEDEITLVFCGSKKSLATGVPMAQVILRGDGRACAFAFDDFSSAAIDALRGASQSLC